MCSPRERTGLPGPPGVYPLQYTGRARRLRASVARSAYFVRTMIHDEMRRADRCRRRPRRLSRRRDGHSSRAAMMAIFMAAVESTIVATASPRSWPTWRLRSSVAFTAYSRAGGDDSDLRTAGRSPRAQAGVLHRRRVFLVASTLCGFARTMPVLTAPALGAGAIQPIATTTSATSTRQPSARIQPYLAIFGLSAIIGPRLRVSRRARKLARDFLDEPADWARGVRHVRRVPTRAAGASSAPGRLHARRCRARGRLRDDGPGTARSTDQRWPWLAVAAVALTCSSCTAPHRRADAAAQARRNRFTPSAMSVILQLVPR